MYYLISFVYNQVEHYCIWFSDDEDYILTDKETIIVFDTVENVMEYAARNGISIEKEDVVKYDIDAVILLCENVYNVNIDCRQVLDFWNICSDVSNSINEKFEGNNEKYDNLYEKIFLGNNLFNDNLEQQPYVPEFSRQEKKNIKNILRNGIKFITENLLTVGTIDSGDVH